MFLHLSVILSTGGVPGQVPPGRHTPWAGTPSPLGRSTSLGRYTPLGRYTSQAGTPPGSGTPSSTRYTPLDQVPALDQQVHLPGRYPPGQVHPPRQVPPPPPNRACWDTDNKRAVRILMECILVGSEITRLNEVVSYPLILHFI